MKYLALLSFCVLLLSCEEEPDYYAIPKLLKDWAYFEKGSYWIYQNDSTLLTDSIFISSIRFQKDSIISDKKLRDIFETIIIDYTNSGNGFNYQSKMHGGTLFFSYTNNTTKIRADCILLRSNINNTIEDSSAYYYISDKYPNLSLNNIIYNDVIVINTSTEYYYFNNSPNDVLYNKYWLSKGNWIIKKVIHTDKGMESWSLIRKRIIQYSLINP